MDKQTFEKAQEIQGEIDRIDSKLKRLSRHDVVTVMLGGRGRSHSTVKFPASAGTRIKDILLDTFNERRTELEKEFEAL